ncbi:MAG: hypothetical protein ACLT3Y_05270 [Ruminococcus callidus]
MSRRKQLKRCCNPAAVLAKEVAAITRIPYRKDLCMTTARDGSSTPCLRHSGGKTPGSFLLGRFH